QNSANAMPEHISALKDRLLDQEVSMEWIDIICDDLMELEQEHNKAITLEEVWQKANEKLLEWLEPYRTYKASFTYEVIDDQEGSEEWIDIMCDDLMEHEQEHKRASSLEDVWQKAGERLLEWLEPYRSMKASLSYKVLAIPVVSLSLFAILPQE